LCNVEPVYKRNRFRLPIGQAGAVNRAMQIDEDVAGGVISAKACGADPMAIA